jgi:hypothetical protein
VHSLPDWRSRSQASSRAAQSIAMVSGSKSALGLTRSTMPAIRALVRQATGLRRWDRGGEFSFSWLRRFNSLGRDGFLAIILAEPERAAALSGTRHSRAPAPLWQRAGGTCAHARGANTSSQASARRGRYEHQAERRAIFAADRLSAGEDEQFGCSLIWATRRRRWAPAGVIELIEELVQRGGGYGLFTGCAAGDTAHGGRHRSGRSAQVIEGKQHG